MKYWVIFVATFLIFSCNNNPDELLIASASNTQFMLEEIVAEFEKETHISTALVVASTGKLLTQIQNGAPFDIFISADTTFSNKIPYKNDIFIQGQLVLWTPKENFKFHIDSLKNAKKIAIGNPDIAPFGNAAKAYLKKEKIWDIIESKLIFGESVGQTIHFGLNGKADFAMVSNASIVNGPLSKKGSWILLEPSVDLLYHSVSLIDSIDNKKSQQFIDLLKSEKAKSIYKKYKYILNPSSD